MSDFQFRRIFDCDPPPGLLQLVGEMIPNPWLSLLSPVNRATQKHSAYIRNSKNESVDFLTLSTKVFYSLFQRRETKVYSCSERWLKAYDGEELFSSRSSWAKWFLIPYKISHAVQLQNFAFRTWYRTLPCKVYLHQLRIADSDNCHRCAEKDDIFHFLFECPAVKSFWDSLASWMDGREGSTHFPDDLTEEEFLLGIIDRPGDQSLLNYIILCAKFYVYKTSVFSQTDPDLFQFLLELKNRLSVERLCCYADHSFARRFESWVPFFEDF